MRIDWFRPRRLARRFAAGEVSNREVAYLMLGNMLFASIVFYGAFTWANPPWTLLSLIEAVAVVAVTIVGFTRVYDAAGGDKNNYFAVLFNILSFGNLVLDHAHCVGRLLGRCLGCALRSIRRVQV